MPRKHLGSPEHPSFELPSLPPWRTPKIKILHHTPSRGQSLLDDGDIFETPYEQKPPVAPNRGKNPDIYDYSPFSDKGLLTASKREQLLNSEAATHCLVFHKTKHKYPPRKSFRPDLDLWCCDSSADEAVNDNDINNDNDDECGRLATATILPPVERPNIRRFENNVSTEKTTLREFWNGSDVADVLERSQLRDICSILQQERDLIHKCERQIQQLDHLPHQNETEHPYRWLRKYCKNVWDKDSWMLDEEVPGRIGMNRGSGINRDT
ncbi:LANO_0C07074g1_1 [Lachancea nothofagi CBS 11611]|uniref:LANO_0C07074g1_1 n=1 Tax=Lachancea nothofagi CBS 11611 TaxID=1266666 RepID=A0A1G4J8E0_9SACH|nr:LANO_0C07074g1_1 [Lachancea nothofagi CBS 11611]